MCDDIHATVAELEAKGVEFSRPIAEERWGSVTAIALPGGGELGLYEPKHPTPTALTRRWSGPAGASVRGVCETIRSGRRPPSAVDLFRGRP